LDDINAKAKACAWAISYSIIRSQNCFNAADKVSKIFENFDASEDKTPKHLKRYVPDIRAASRQGHNHAHQAQEEFRNVRQNLFQVKLA